MIRREQSQGGRIGGGPDEPLSASMRKGKPGRTAPSSRVKKKKKSGQSGFIGPRKFEDELAEDRSARHKKRVQKYVIEETDEPIPFGKDVRKRVNDGVSHFRFINDEVPIRHNEGRGLKKGQRLRRDQGVNEDPYSDPAKGLQSERLRELLRLLERKLYKLDEAQDVPF